MRNDRRCQRGRWRVGRLLVSRPACLLGSHHRLVESLEVGVQGAEESGEGADRGEAAGSLIAGDHRLGDGGAMGDIELGEFPDEAKLAQGRAEVGVPGGPLPCSRAAR